MEPWGLYLHIPFCRRKCAYCDFPSYAGLESCHAEYMRALQAEILAMADRHPISFDTIFIGGGTPTLLGAEAIAEVLETCRQRMRIAPEAEVTVEANPGTVSTPDWALLRAAGVTRLSLGVQSLRDADLLLLGRIHSAAQAREAYYMARGAGLKNINLDLMFGLPGQRLDDWRNVLHQALALEAEHLSLYALTVEADTPIAAALENGNLPAIDDGLVAEMYELAERLLDSAGYVHYEISNWAHGRQGVDIEGIPKLACAHNLRYWRNQPYLGLGAAAHSYDGVQRMANTTNPDAYIARVLAGQAAMEQSEPTDVARRMGETMMLGLRLITGVTEARFHRSFGMSLEAVYGREIEDLVADGLLQRDERGIRLTPRGRLLGNRVFAAFLR